MSLENTNLGLSFKNYFEIVPALSNELKNEVYRIRHKVYCEDLKFEQIRAEGMEIDEYDSHSLHLLIRCILTNEFIGCTRIVRPRPDDMHHPLPFEKTCNSFLNKSIVDPQKLPRLSIAEVSRLAVIASFRRRKGEENSAIALSDEDFSPFSISQSQKRTRFPYIPLGLYLGTAELARINGIETLFVLTEERLANHLGKLGFGIRFIGEPVDHNGSRLPSMMSVEGIIKGMKPSLRPLYKTIASDLNRYRLAPVGSSIA